MKKQIISAVLAVLMILSSFSFSAFAVNIQDGDWTFTATDGKAEIIAYSGSASTVTVPETLHNAGSAFTTVKIGSDVFSSSTANTVNLPETLTDIAAGAFTGSSVKNLYVPVSCTSIQDGAFDSSLTVYSFGEAFAQDFCTENNIGFVQISASSSYNIYIGNVSNIQLATGANLSSSGNTVSVSGRSITALKEGTAYLSAAFLNGICGTIKVVCKPAPAITGVPANKTLYSGETYSITAKVVNYSVASSFSYTSSNTAVASVAANGKITAKSAGKTNIKVMYGTLSATMALTVGNESKSVSLNYSSLKLGIGENRTLSYTLSSGTIIKSFTYTSSNSKVATVTAAGKITPKAVGDCTITFKADNGLTANCTLRVYNAPKAVAFVKKYVTLGKGETFKLTPYVNSGASCSTYKWKSVNTAVASVSSNGTVKALKNGKVNIYVYTYSSGTKVIRNYATVTVKSAPSKLSFSKSSIVLGLGETYDLNLVLPKGSASYKNTYSVSSGENIKVGAAFIITALKTGTAVITAKTYNNKTATCKITIRNAPSAVKCKPTTVKLSLKQKYKLSPYVNADSACTSYKYRSANTSICTVSKDGTVYAKDYGNCNIYIYTYNSTSEKTIYTKVLFTVGYITNKVASYTTQMIPYYNGKAVNLKQVCKYINGKTDGYILQPGETFSYNRAVGQRTSARGFVTGSVVSGSGYRDAIGGGICQGSSTIFNAALYGNFTIVERSAHNLKSHYVPVGRDATVYWGVQDFKFKNNYNTPIRIKMNCYSRSINCSIYSLKKVSVPKVSLQVTGSGHNYLLKRFVNGKCNYSVRSIYSD